MLVVANRLIDVVYQPTNEKMVSDKRAKQESLVTPINMPKDIRHASLQEYDQTPERTKALIAANRFSFEVVAKPKDFSPRSLSQWAFWGRKDLPSGCYCK